MVSRKRTQKAQRQRPDLTVGVGCPSLGLSHMRRKVTVERLRQFMDELAASARSPGKVYFAGGATALLLGFREQTIDIDINRTSCATPRSIRNNLRKKSG